MRQCNQFHLIVAHILHFVSGVCIFYFYNQELPKKSYIDARAPNSFPLTYTLHMCRYIFEFFAPIAPTKYQATHPFLVNTALTSTPVCAIAENMWQL